MRIHVLAGCLFAIGCATTGSDGNSAPSTPSATASAQSLDEQDRAGHARDPKCIGDVHRYTLEQWRENAEDTNRTFESKTTVLGDVDSDGLVDRAITVISNCGRKGNCLQLLFLSNHGCTTYAGYTSALKFQLVSDGPEDQRGLYEFERDSRPGACKEDDGLGSINRRVYADGKLEMSQGATIHCPCPGKASATMPELPICAQFNG